MVTSSGRARGWLLMMTLALASGSGSLVACGDEPDDGPSDGGTGGSGEGGEGGESGEGGEGGEGGAQPGDPYVIQKAAKEVGPEGGSVELVGVAKLTIPAGAVAQKTMFTVSEIRAEKIAEIAPTQGAAGKRVAFEPHGFLFASEVAIEIPRTKEAPKTSKSKAMKLSDEADDSWEEATVKTTAAEAIEVATTTFSIYAAIEVPDPVPVCPNHVCEVDLGEAYASCPTDCVATCGDLSCDDSVENAYACPSDCPAGCLADAVCDILFETQVSCAADCGTCGDLSCNGDFEDYTRCATDCYCGDGICMFTDGEDYTTCPGDCG